MSQLSYADKKLYKRIDEVIHYLWDPIGVSFWVNARNEYSSYTARVFKLVKNKASRREIVEYLNEVVTNRIGLSKNNKKSKKLLI